MGCSRPRVEETKRNAMEQQQQEENDVYLFQAQRGYNRPDDLCEGRIFFAYDDYGKPYVSCEHYDRTTNKDHFIDRTINSGMYDLEYLEAVLCEDTDEIERIEDAAFSLGYGPLLGTCNTIANCSSQKAYCPFDHRDQEGNLVQPLMTRLECRSRFRIFEPIEEERKKCPFILLIAQGSHTHPIPLPTKTPPKIRARLFTLLLSLENDLPDVTPRRFLRHPIVQAFLRNKFPLIPTPTLSDWHISLANRSHIGSYIKQAREQYCPFGTDWAGVTYLKLQEESLPREEQYIRKMITVDEPPPDHEDEEATSSTSDRRLRIIVCMFPEMSRRLIQAGQYLQSDIGFKRVIGFMEFELAAMDRDANTSAIFSRVFVNRQTAHAHFLIFQAIHHIIEEDTGCSLQWFHLHGEIGDVEEENGLEGLILSFMADQHRGQALGLGLYLQALAQTLPEKLDLYEPWRTIQSLTPYEHLRRCFRICTLHIFRNIKTTKVSSEVKWLMRSLVCTEHDDWEGTIAAICEQGGKAGQDWVKDKETSRFAFPGLCWEKSLLPLAIWKAGERTSNLVESVHRDVNRDGVHCTLLGGLTKGRSFDKMKLKTIEAFEKYGIKPTFRSGHISENAYFNLKRRDVMKHRELVSDDAKIEKYNLKLQKAYDSIVAIHHVLQQKRSDYQAEMDPVRRQRILEALNKKETARRKALDSFHKLTEGGQSLEKTGSGKIPILKLDVAGF
ncbi:hypothetical protein B0H19DRAFT_1020702 [Mycena capillaripes]|nr:hypothetical protein B0H19DRAFT_1020702 [Mycena capillaripes]